MKVVLFRDGRPGVAAALPGEAPETELSDLLGGEPDVTPLGMRLELLTLHDAERQQLPIRYSLHRIGRAAEPVAGDAVVVRVGADRNYRDADGNDVEAANCYLRPTGR